jgi:hypothetical protein
MSSHCAPSLHLHVCCVLKPARHMEHFRDHCHQKSVLHANAAREVLQHVEVSA